MNEDKYLKVLKFYLLATKLKYKIRSGWDKNHWNINNDRIESIAEHIYGVCILAIGLDSEFDFKLNIDKVIKMLVIHELGEVIIGDITPFDDITLEEKKKIEHEAIKKVIGDLVKKEELISLIYEFDERITNEAKFAYYCDKLEADLQSKVYQDLGYQHSLDDQKDNIVFKNEKTNQMINEGATTAFDIWYEWDKEKFKNNAEFSRTLKIIKELNTKEILN